MKPLMKSQITFRTNSAVFYWLEGASDWSAKLKHDKDINFDAQSCVSCIFSVFVVKD